MAFNSWVSEAARRDRLDALSRFRDEFHFPGDQIYLDGNSLGLLPRRSERAVARVLAEWRDFGIDGWTRGSPPWLDLSEAAARGLAPLIGASAAEICVGGSTTGNLHQLLATLFAPNAKRNVILGDALNFASDAHAIQSHLRLRGLDPKNHYREVRTADGHTLREADIIAAFTPDVQLVLLPSVIYTSGQLLDVGKLSREARARGILIGWDCSHSIGAVPHDFQSAAPDFAFWCSYKYLNAGPGAVAGMFLHSRHHAVKPGLAGWWGVNPAERFALRHEHEPAPAAGRLHIGTPHILSLAPLSASLELFTEAGGVEPLRRKSLALTQWMMEIADAELKELGFAIATPRADAERGGHVALSHPEAWRLCQALKRAGVVPDYRPPNLIRLAPTALYNSFTDCAEALQRLHQITTQRSYEDLSRTPSLVT